MLRLVARSAVAVSLLLPAAYGENSQTVDAGASDQQTPSISASPPSGTSSASPSAKPTGQTSKPPPTSAVKDEDLALIRDFVAFAVRPSPEPAARLPFAGELQLGLSRDLKTTLNEAEARPQMRQRGCSTPSTSAPTRAPSARWNPSSVSGREPLHVRPRPGRHSTPQSETTRTAQVRLCQRLGALSTIGACRCSRQSHPSTVACLGSLSTST